MTDRRRLKRMFADTDAIRALGSTNSTHADDLIGTAAALSSLPLAAPPSSLGPAGARFLSALIQAATDASHAAATISDHLSMSDTTARGIASAYDATDRDAAGRIAGARL